MSRNWDDEWDGTIDAKYNRELVTHAARIRVYCDVEGRNFHKRHGRHWLAEFGLRFPDAPPGHWIRWESIGHATRSPYRTNDDNPYVEPDGALETLVEAEIEARGLYDDATGVPDAYAAGDVWTEALDELGRFVPRKLIKMSNPAIDRARFVEWVGEPPPPNWVPQSPLVKGARWTSSTVEIPTCPCGMAVPPLPTTSVVMALDALADNEISKISANGFQLAVNACTT